MGKLANPWRGMFAIAATPFFEDGRLDGDGLGRVV